MTSFSHPSHGVSAMRICARS